MLKFRVNDIASKRGVTTVSKNENENLSPIHPHSRRRRNSYLEAINNSLFSLQQQAATATTTRRQSLLAPCPTTSAHDNIFQDASSASSSSSSLNSNKIDSGFGGSGGIETAGSSPVVEEKDKDLIRQEHIASFRNSITRQIELTRARLRAEPNLGRLKPQYESVLDRMEEKYQRLLGDRIGKKDISFEEAYKEFTKIRKKVLKETKTYTSEIKTHASFLEKQAEFTRSYTAIIERYKNSSLFSNDERFKKFLDSRQKKAIKSLTEETDKQGLSAKFEHLKQELARKVVPHAINQKYRELQDHVTHHVGKYVNLQDYKSPEWRDNMKNVVSALDDLKEELIATKDPNFEQKLLERTQQIKEFINEKVTAYVKRYYVLRLQNYDNLIYHKIKFRPPILGDGFRRGFRKGLKKGMKNVGKNLWENICYFLNRGCRLNNKHHRQVMADIDETLKTIQLLQNPHEIESVANVQFKKIAEDKHNYMNAIRPSLSFRILTKIKSSIDPQ